MPPIPLHATLPEGLTIRPAAPTSKGVGLVTTRAFDAGALLFRGEAMLISTVPSDPDSDLPYATLTVHDRPARDGRVVGVYPIHLGRHTTRLPGPGSTGRRLLHTGLGSLINHGCDPSTVVDALGDVGEEDGQRYEVRASRPLAAGDELTCDYTLVRYCDVFVRSGLLCDGGALTAPSLHSNATPTTPIPTNNPTRSQAEYDATEKGIDPCLCGAPEGVCMGAMRGFKVRRCVYTCPCVFTPLSSDTDFCPPNHNNQSNQNSTSPSPTNSAGLGASPTRSSAVSASTASSASKSSTAATGPRGRAPSSWTVGWRDSRRGCWPRARWGAGR